MPDSLRPRGPIRLSVHGILQARILEWVAILQGIFPTQGSNPGLPHCQQTLTPEPPGKPTDAGGRLPSLRLDPVPSGFPGGWGKASAHHCRRLDGSWSGTSHAHAPQLLSLGSGARTLQLLKPARPRARPQHEKPLQGGTRAGEPPPPRHGWGEPCSSGNPRCVSS